MPMRVTWGRTIPWLGLDVHARWKLEWVGWFGQRWRAKWHSHTRGILLFWSVVQVSVNHRLTINCQLRCVYSRLWLGYIRFRLRRLHLDANGHESRQDAPSMPGRLWRWGVVTTEDLLWRRTLVKTLLNDMLLCAPVITWNLSGFSHGKRTVVWPLAMCRNMAMFGHFSSQSMDSLFNLAVFCTVCTLLPRCFQSS